MAGVTNVVALPLTEVLEFDADQFKSTPIIYNNRVKLSRELFRGRRPATIRRQTIALKHIEAFIKSYCSTHKTDIADASDIDSTFSAAFLFQLNDESQKDFKLRTFNRVLKCIGVPKRLLLPNAYRQEDTKNPRSIYSDKQVRGLVKQAKYEADFVIARMKEAEAAGPGLDPRRKSAPKIGEKTNAWHLLANRLWTIRNVIPSEFKTWDENNREFPGIVRSLERYPGAKALYRDGQITRKKGLVAHMRYLYPDGFDLAPFVVLTLIHTFFNLATVATLTVGQWYRPYPFSAGASTADSACYIVGTKHRGKQHHRDPPKIVRAISLMKPYSHAYQVLKTVEKLTQPLRDVVIKQVVRLERIKRPTAAEKANLSYLRSIKDRVFLYRSIDGIRGIGHEHSPPKWLIETLKRYGLPTTVRTFRDTGLALGFVASGSNIAILQMLGSHSNTLVSALYTKRKQLLDQREETVKSIFASSMELIADGNFSWKSLSQKLSAQGFRTRQISNTLNRDNETVWGNRCAEPDTPPTQFARGTPPGSECVGQRCIDGCPLARWFPDSIPQVRAQLAEQRRLKAGLGADATMGSSYDSQIARLESLISMWPDHIRERYPDHPVNVKEEA
ncbi:hypothetical protein DXU03_17685 [Rhizobium johnstonii]